MPQHRPTAQLSEDKLLLAKALATAAELGELAIPCTTPSEAAQLRLKFYALKKQAAAYATESIWDTINVHAEPLEFLIKGSILLLRLKTSNPVLLAIANALGVDAQTATKEIVEESAQRMLQQTQADPAADRVTKYYKREG